LVKNDFIQFSYGDAEPTLTILHLTHRQAQAG
jgi:hypothetical protein